MTRLWWIKTHYACFGVESVDKLVVDAAPIARWSIGKDIDWVLHYYQDKKRAEIKLVSTLD